MPIRVPSKIVQLNDAINFPVVTSLEIEVDDIEGLFTTQSGLSSGIGARGYKNLDEVLAQLSSGLTLDSGVFTDVGYYALTEDKTDYDILSPIISGQYYLEPDAEGWTIKGIVAPSGPVTRKIRITNVSEVYSIVLADKNVSAVAANRIITGLGIDYTLPPLGTAVLVYDVTADRWRIDV